MKKIVFTVVLSIVLLFGAVSGVVASAEFNYFYNQRTYAHNFQDYCPVAYNNTYVFDNTELSPGGGSDNLTDKTNKVVTSSISESGGNYAEAYVLVHSKFLFFSDLQEDTDTGNANASVILEAEYSNVINTIHRCVAKEDSETISHLLISYNDD